MLNSAWVAYASDYALIAFCDSASVALIELLVANTFPVHVARAMLAYALFNSEQRTQN